MNRLGKKTYPATAPEPKRTRRSPTDTTMKSPRTKKRRPSAKETQEQFLLRTLMENIPIHVYLKDLDSRFIVVSESKARRDGMESAAMVGKTDFDAKVPHARRQAVAIGLALLPHQLRMSGAKNDVTGVWARFDDFGHRVEHGINAFVWR